MAEFVIALPLLILLIYTLANIFLNVNKSAKNQAADYVLEEEAHEILERISNDARAASEVTYSKQCDLREIVFVFHSTATSSSTNIIDVLDTRRYILYSKKEDWTGEGHEKIYHVYAQRQAVNTPTSPISGENILRNTTVTKFDFEIREENILHISLEIKSLTSGRTLSINTSVFMPACEKISGDF